MDIKKFLSRILSDIAAVILSATAKCSHLCLQKCIYQNFCKHFCEFCYSGKYIKRPDEKKSIKENRQTHSVSAAVSYHVSEKSKPAFPVKDTKENNKPRNIANPENKADSRLRLTFKEAQQAGFQFCYSHRGFAVITSIHVKSEKIIIPAYIDGHPVELIAGECRCIIDPDITNAVLVLPDTLRIIGDRAFKAFHINRAMAPRLKSGRRKYWEPVLTEVYFPEGYVYIGKLAFYEQTRLKSLHFGRRAFIEDCAFGKCTALEEVRLRECTLRDKCFGNCTALSRVTWEKAEYCGDRVFYNTPFEKSCDVLITGDVLQRVSTDEKTFTVPEGIRKIGEKAFENLSSLERVILPPSVSTINRYAFAGCDKLWDIDLRNVGIIYGGAFSRCASLDSRTKISENTRFRGYPFDGTLLERENVTKYGIVINGTLFGELPDFPGNVWQISDNVRRIAGEAGYYNFWRWKDADINEVIFPESVEEISDIRFFDFAQRLTFKNPDVQICCPSAYSRRNISELIFITEKGRSPIPVIYPKNIGDNPAYRKVCELYSSVFEGTFDINAYDDGILETGMPLKMLTDIAYLRLNGGYRLTAEHRRSYEAFLKLHIKKALKYADAENDTEKLGFLRCIFYDKFGHMPE